MIKLRISYQLNANSERKEFVSSYPNEHGITSVIFGKGHENELAAEAPFIATAIWKDIDTWTQHHQVMRNSVECAMEFSNGKKFDLSTDVINAKHNTEVLNS